jgi:Na+-transporting NADH:ubiquinone oxidoreductase subunit NqrB
MMLAILLGNVTAPVIDYCVVKINLRRRRRRLELS